MFDPFTISVILIVIMTIMGLSVGLAMMAGVIVFLLLNGYDTSLGAETLLQGLFNGYTLISIPLFILAADIMNLGTLSDRLLRFSQALVGRFKGGLGHVNVVSSVIFSGMSGSAIADAVGMGRIIIGMMTRDGKYTPAYAAAITAASATIGPIIPPSIPMVLYALISNTSIGFLFAAGIFPGLLMALVLIIMNSIIAHKRDIGTDEATKLSEFPRVTARAFPALMLPVILLGGIYSGITTPTEAAAVAAFYALVISVVAYRSVSVRQFYQTLVQSSRSTASVGILVAGALAFNFVIAREGIPDSIASYLAQYEMSKITFLITINLLILALGCVLEGGAILLIIVPIFIPTAQLLGIDMIHFGVIVLVNSMLGLITPPYGMLLFVVSSITGTPIQKIIREVLPFLLALLVALVFINAAPDFVLYLPRALGYQG
ncbi:TRAP transporter large permease [Saccharospirillum sp.]|uniref:TRAP transporter large permease n=1 Tax=Saccharospirillum sp. TaxID=2033801 RepID=UPI0034A02018